MTFDSLANTTSLTSTGREDRASVPSPRSGRSFPFAPGWSGVIAGSLLLAAGCSSDSDTESAHANAVPGQATSALMTPPVSATLLPVTLEAENGSALGSTLPGFSVKADPLAELTTEFTKSYAEFLNPERGMAGWADLVGAWDEGVKREIADGHTLLRAHIQLDAFRYQPLSSQWIERLEKGFAMIRLNGTKVIPRFTYNSPESSFVGGYHIAEDAPIDHVLNHIEQLGPVLSRNADVIAWIEAGFVGAWGEWHSSQRGLDANASEDRIKDALLSNFPQNRKIAFRNPSDLRRWYPETPPASGRAGIHNDCILSGRDDAYTWAWPEVDNLKGYVRASTLSAPYGGETCFYTPQLTDCDSIRSHGTQLRLTWLNRYGAFSAYRSGWQAQGCYAEVLRSMGYRLELESLSVSKATVARGEVVRFTVALRNSGWAPLYNARTLQIVLLSNGQPAQRIDMPEADLRNVLPNNDTPAARVFQSQVTVPAGSANGLFEVAIAAPDPLLPDDARQAVRFANEDRSQPAQAWVPDGGFFRTGTWLRIAGGS